MQQNLRNIIIIFLVLLFSNLGISYFREGFECQEYDKEGTTCIKQKKSNNFIVVVLLLMFIVWVILVHQHA